MFKKIKRIPTKLLIGFYRRTLSSDYAFLKSYLKEIDKRILNFNNSINIDIKERDELILERDYIKKILVHLAVSVAFLTGYIDESIIEIEKDTNRIKIKNQEEEE